MLKTFLAFLATACLLAAFAAALGYLPFVPPMALLVAACAIFLVLAVLAGARRLAVAACAVLASASLAGCNSLPGTGGANFDINAFLNSTTCAHDDKVQGVTGAAGIPASLQFSAERHCPAAGAATAAPPIAVGTVVAPPPPAGR